MMALKIAPDAIGYAGFYDDYPWLSFAPFMAACATAHPGAATATLGLAPAGARPGVRLLQPLLRAAPGLEGRLEQPHPRTLCGTHAHLAGAVVAVHLRGKKEWVVAGVTSGGDLACLKYDRNTRLVRYFGWIALGK